MILTEKDFKVREKVTTNGITARTGGVITIPQGTEAKLAEHPQYFCVVFNGETYTVHLNSGFDSLDQWHGTPAQWHKFQAAGLGKAPFKFVGIKENVARYPDGTTKAGGTCDYCSTGIRFEFWCESADKKKFKVGCDCISKVGDEGLKKAYKSSPAFRQHQRKLREKKAANVREEVKALMTEENRAKLALLPHRSGFTDRRTGQPLTALDDVTWRIQHSGNAGMVQVLKSIKTYLT
jgi:hypothetical protein